MYRAEKMNVPVLKTVSKLDIDMNATATADENETREELQQMVERIEASLGADHAKLSRMKDDFKNDVRRQQEEHSVMEAELGVYRETHTLH